MKRSIVKAAKLYEAFRERSPQRAKSITVKLPSAVIVMGYVSAIEYETTHGKRAQGYRHAFAAGSRPLLCAGPGKNELFLLAGHYHVTERGIVDLDRKGNEIDDT